MFCMGSYPSSLLSNVLGSGRPGEAGRDIGSDIFTDTQTGDIKLMLINDGEGLI